MIDFLMLDFLDSLITSDQILGIVYRTVCLVRAHPPEGNTLVDEYVKMSCGIHTHQHDAFVGASGVP